MILLLWIRRCLREYMKKIFLFLTVIILFIACDDNKKSKQSAEYAFAIFQHKMKQDSIGLVRIEEYLQWKKEIYVMLKQLGYSDKRAYRKIDSIKIQNFMSTYNEIPKWYYDFKKTEDSSFTFDLNKVGENH